MVMFQSNRKKIWQMKRRERVSEQTYQTSRWTPQVRRSKFWMKFLISFFEQRLKILLKMLLRTNWTTITSLSLEVKDRPRPWARLQQGIQKDHSSVAICCLLYIYLKENEIILKQKNFPFKKFVLNKKLFFLQCSVWSMAQGQEGPDLIPVEESTQNHCLHCRWVQLQRGQGCVWSDERQEKLGDYCRWVI